MSKKTPNIGPILLVVILARQLSLESLDALQPSHNEARTNPLLTKKKKTGRKQQSNLAPLVSIVVSFRTV